MATSLLTLAGKVVRMSPNSVAAEKLKINNRQPTGSTRAIVVGHGLKTS